MLCNFQLIIQYKLQIIRFGSTLIFSDAMIDKLNHLQSAEHVGQTSTNRYSYLHLKISYRSRERWIIAEHVGAANEIIRSMIEIYLRCGAVSVPLSPRRESRADFISVAFGVRPSKLQQQTGSRGLKRNCHRHRAGGGEKGSGWWWNRSRRMLLC